MIGTLSKHAAAAEGFDDALMLDWEGRVAEATGANVFLVIEGALRRDLSMEVKERVYQVAFVCLILFAAFVMLNDITKLHNG